MQFRQDKIKSKMQPRLLPLRRQRGSVAPLLAFSLIFVFAFLAFVMDLMREVLEIQQMKHAARAAALAILPYASLDSSGQLQNNSLIDSDGSFTETSMLSMKAELERIMQSELARVNQTITNPDPANQSSWLKELSFDPADLSAAPGSSQSQGPYLTLTARRSDQDRFSFLFFPVVYAAANLGGADSASTFNGVDLLQKVEVCMQPASKIGPGAPAESSGQKAAAIFNARLCSFPLVLNYDDFKRFLQNSAAQTACTIHVKSAAGSSQANTNTDMRGYFANLRSGGSTGDYYFDAQSSSRIDDLLGLFDYFNKAPVSGKSTVPPAALERGAQLDRFDIEGFDDETNNNLTATLSQLPLNRSYILPVVHESAGSICEVAGFALLRLSSFTKLDQEYSFSFTLSESLPVLNASAGTMRSLPRLDGTQLAPFADRQTNPFLPRSFDPLNNVFSQGKAGLVMAPVLSPRKIFLD